MNYFTIPSLAIQGIESPMGRRPKAQKIINEVLKFYHFSWQDIDRRSRKSEIKNARQVIMYLLCTQTNMSLSAIGKLFTRQFDHTTVLYAREVIRDHISTGLLASDIKQILEKVNS